MPKSDTKAQLNVTVNIRPGQVSPAQKAALRRFWQRIIAEVTANER